MREPDYIDYTDGSGRAYVSHYDEAGIYFDNGDWCTWGDWLAMEDL